MFGTRISKVAMLLAALIHLGGCATGTPRDTPLDILSGDTYPGSETKFYIASGSYSVNLLVSVDWQTVGSKRHEMVSPPQGKYLIFAYEVGHGIARVKEVRKTSENIPKEPMDPNAKAFAEGLAQGAGPLILTLAIVTAPIWGPIYLTSRPESLPTGGFLWMEDAETGERVVGTLPW